MAESDGGDSFGFLLNGLDTISGLASNDFAGAAL